MESENNNTPAPPTVTNPENSDAQQTTDYTPTPQPILIQDNGVFEEGYWKGTLNSLDLFFRVTKQVVLETFGKAAITEDADIKIKLQELDDMKANYDNLIKLGNKFCTHFEGLASTMSDMAILYTTIGVKDKNEHILRVAECYRAISKQTQPYIQSLKTFYQTISHFREKVLEDTVETSKKFAEARFIYDIFTDKLKQQEAKKANPAMLEKVKEEYENSKEVYIQLKKDLDVKIQLLNMKRVSDLEFQMSVYMKNMQLYYATVNSIAEKVSGMQVEPQTLVEQVTTMPNVNTIVIESVSTQPETSPSTSSAQPANTVDFINNEEKKASDS